MSINISETNYNNYLNSVNNILNRISILETNRFNISNLNNIKTTFASIMSWDDPIGNSFTKKLNNLNNKEYESVYNSITKGKYQTLKTKLNEAKTNGNNYKTKIDEYEKAKEAYEEALNSFNNSIDDEELDDFEKYDYKLEKRRTETEMNEAKIKKDKARIDFMNSLNELATIHFEESNLQEVQFERVEYIEEPIVLKEISDTLIETWGGNKIETDIYFDPNTGNRVNKDAKGEIKIFTNNSDETVSIYVVPSSTSKTDMKELCNNPPKEYLVGTYKAQGSYDVSINGKRVKVYEHAQDKFFLYASQNGLLVFD